MLFENLEKSPLEIILCLLPLFIVIVIVIGFYIGAQFFKGNDKPLKNMLSVLCAIFVLIIAGSCIYCFNQTGSYIITTLAMILSIIPISAIISEIKRRNR